MTEPQDRELIRRVQSSDCQESKAVLYQRHARSVIKQVLGYRVPREDAKDIVQEVFLAAFTKLGDLEDSDRFGAWVGKIAYNRCMKHFEQAARKKAALEGFAAEAFAHLGSPGEAGVRELEIAAVRSVIAKMEEDKRGPIEDFYIEGLSCDEIAGKRGMSVTAVTTRLNRFRAKASGELIRRVLEIRDRHER